VAQVRIGGKEDQRRISGSGYAWWLARREVSCRQGSSRRFRRESEVGEKGARETERKMGGDERRQGGAGDWGR
jgi:hypothetical protein